MGNILSAVGAGLARYLSRRTHVHGTGVGTPSALLLDSLQPGDVLLVDGDTHFSTAIKYLTQSTWSHAAIFVGPGHFSDVKNSEHCFVEADVTDGVRSVGVDAFDGQPTRICRPVGLMEKERRLLIDFVIERIGHRYDLRNVFDLARYLLPTPPVPTRFRRRMIALGSGDPTRAICSTLISQAFQSIGYPILPLIERRSAPTTECPGCFEDILHIRHHSLFAPRDFDVSPYFQIIKPSLDRQFDYKTLNWSRSDDFDEVINETGMPRQPSKTLTA